MARQGTVAPTHFNVIWDRTGLVITLKLFLNRIVLFFLQIEG